VSTDYRLGALQTFTLGATFGFHPDDDAHEWTVRAEYIGQFGKGEEEEAIGVQSRFDLFPTVNVFTLVGGDLYASDARRGPRPWAIGLDDPERTGEAAGFRFELSKGGLATSGDARRYVLFRGRRRGHILNPKIGWPIEDAPRSVTVVASTCVEAGTLSTLAYLQGPGARDFLEAEGVQFRIL
jgi:hypothetical protein